MKITNDKIRTKWGSLSKLLMTQDTDTLLTALLLLLVKCSEKEGRCESEAGAQSCEGIRAIVGYFGGSVAILNGVALNAIVSVVSGNVEHSHSASDRACVCCLLLGGGEVGRKIVSDGEGVCTDACVHFVEGGGWADAVASLSVCGQVETHCALLITRVRALHLSVN